MVRVMPELALMYAVPNAGKRSDGAARYMVSEGLRAGVPDVCLPVARGGYHALYIEHKSAKGKTTENQERWMAMLRAHGNAVLISRSFETSREAIVAYLAGRLGPGDHTTLK